MSWDWDYEHAYPGGPMVAVKGFPRPCYSSDAGPSHAPSSDGSDIEAYKRTVSRAGRWDWQTFDQTFSNAFSHGKAGGNVSNSGIAGVQRQQGIQPTGFLGKETFNLLRSIRIPEGLPNAGQPAMDARSVELLNAAWDRFGGTDLPEPSPNEARLERAIGELGKHESPSGSNQQGYGKWYGMNGVPWCAIFATWADQTGPEPSETFVRGSRYSYVPYVLLDARAGKYGLSITSSPKPGDLVLYDWARDGEYDHMGIVEVGLASNGDFTAIEGNTAVGNDSNGGQVMRRARNRNGQATVFVRVAS